MDDSASSDSKPDPGTVTVGADTFHALIKLCASAVALAAAAEGTPLPPPPKRKPRPRKTHLKAVEP